MKKLSLSLLLVATLLGGLAWRSPPVESSAPRTTPAAASPVVTQNIETIDVGQRSGFKQSETALRARGASCDNRSRYAADTPRRRTVPRREPACNASTSSTIWSTWWYAC